MADRKRVFSFEESSFFKREYSFTMIHPETGNLCPKTGTTVKVKSKGHNPKEAEAGAIKICSVNWCQTAYILKK